MVANVIEGILLQPEIPGEHLNGESEKQIVGEYKDEKGRIMVVFAGGDELPTQYMIYWEPKNPNAPISRGSVLRNKKGETIFYQPGESDVVTLTRNRTGKEDESVEFPKLEIVFERFDIEAWSREQKK